MLALRLNDLFKVAILAFYAQTSLSEAMYKCIVQGKVTYTSAPESPSACEWIDLQVIQPNPQDVARAIKDNQKHEAIELERQKQRDKEQNKQAAAQRALIVQLNRLGSGTMGQRRRGYYPHHAYSRRY